MRALKAGRVPPPVHRLQVKPVGYPEAASGANHPRNILGLRWRGGWRLQLRDRVQVFRGLLLLRVSLRVQMRVMVVMVVVRLRRHAQVARVLEVAVAVPVLLATCLAEINAINIAQRSYSFEITLCGLVSPSTPCHGSPARTLASYALLSF